MEELLEKLENEIKDIKEEQTKLEKLTKKSEKIKEEEKQLAEELEAIPDVESGFYKDVKEQLDEKHEEFIDANNARMREEKELDTLIKNKKEEIKKEIANKKQYVDENRKADLDELRAIDVDKLKAEKEKLEKEIELNDITREEFDKKSDSEKSEIRQAKENYLNNKKRLAEINPTLQLIETLDGKTPKEKFIELDDLDKSIDENFNRNKLDNIIDKINKAKEDKEDIETLLEQMIAGREKREEERYYEDIKAGLEETKRRIEEKIEEPKETKKTVEIDEGIKKKAEKIKKEIEVADRDYKNIHLKVGPRDVINRVKIKDEMNKITNIYIDEKEGMIYTKTKSGNEQEELLSEAILHKKNLYELLEIKEMCKEIAGGSISGLLLGIKVNPAIVYALRKEPAEIKNYITCLKEQKELPFELSHDLRNSCLNFINRAKMWVRARAEDKIPGTNIIISDRRWDKNKAIGEPKEIKTSKSYMKSEEVHKPFEMYKQVNRDNHIEKNAIKRILEQEEQRRAEEMREFTENEKNEHGR